MNRSIVARELKSVGVSLNGWMPVLQCEVCKQRWEAFHTAVGASAPTAKVDYWMCPNKCNATAQVSREMEASVPKYVLINGMPGITYGDEDLREFERYARSMDSTITPNREI
jgi:hypothetical protein